MTKQTTIVVIGALRVKEIVGYVRHTKGDRHSVITTIHFQPGELKAGLLTQMTV